MSTLSRGDEIERDFYALKAQEWACEPHEAEEKIKGVLVRVRAEFILRRYQKSYLYTTEGGDRDERLRTTD